MYYGGFRVKWYYCGILSILHFYTKCIFPNQFEHLCFCWVPERVFPFSLLILWNVDNPKNKGHDKWTCVRRDLDSEKYFFDHEDLLISQNSRRAPHWIFIHNPRMNECNNRDIKGVFRKVGYLFFLRPHLWIFSLGPFFLIHKKCEHPSNRNKVLDDQGLSWKALNRLYSRFY